MPSNDPDAILSSTHNIEVYIMRLSASTNQAVDIILKELDTELKSHMIYEPSGYPKVTAISQYPYEYKEAPNALNIMMRIGTANGRDGTNTTQYQNYIKELETKLIEIYYSVQSEAENPQSITKADLD